MEPSAGWTSKISGRSFVCLQHAHACLDPHADVASRSALTSGVAAPQVEAERLSGGDNQVLLTGASSSQPGLLYRPLLPDVPVVTGVEESGGAAAEQEDKEELEFPHDLLPSLDFSSELNIWESSLGYGDAGTHIDTFVWKVSLGF